MEECIMQKLYGRNQIPDLRKKSGIIEYLDVHYIDPKSMMFILVIVMMFIVSIMCVAAYPNSNMPFNV
jgi:hypothetical protein